MRVSLVSRKLIQADEDTEAATPHGVKHADEALKPCS